MTNVGLLGNIGQSVCVVVKRSDVATRLQVHKYILGESTVATSEMQLGVATQKVGRWSRHLTSYDKMSQPIPLRIFHETVQNTIIILGSTHRWVFLRFGDNDSRYALFHSWMLYSQSI